MRLLSSRSSILTCVHVFSIDVGMLSALCGLRVSLWMCFAAPVYLITLIWAWLALQYVSLRSLLASSYSYSLHSQESHREEAAVMLLRKLVPLVFESLEREASTEFSSSPCFPR